MAQINVSEWVSFKRLEFTTPAERLISTLNKFKSERGLFSFFGRRNFWTFIFIYKPPRHILVSVWNFILWWRRPLLCSSCVRLVLGMVKPEQIKWHWLFCVCGAAARYYQVIIVNQTPRPTRRVCAFAVCAAAIAAHLLVPAAHPVWWWGSHLSSIIMEYYLSLSLLSRPGDRRSMVPFPWPTLLCTALIIYTYLRAATAAARERGALFAPPRRRRHSRSPLHAQCVQIGGVLTRRSLDTWVGNMQNITFKIN